MGLPHAEVAKFALCVEIAHSRRSMKPEAVSVKIANIVERHRHVLRGVRYTLPVCAVSLPHWAIAILKPSQFDPRSGLRVSICQVQHGGTVSAQGEVPQNRLAMPICPTFKDHLGAPE